MNFALQRTSWRYYTRHPLQTLLLLFGIALGVALMVAVDLANHSAKRAFQLSAESLTGKATYQIVSSSGKLPESVYRDLRVKHHYQALSPVVEGPLQLKAPGPDAEAVLQRWKVLGVDPFVEAPFRDFLQHSDQSLPLDQLLPLITQPRTVMIATPTAQQLGLQVGQQLALSNQPPLKLVGLLNPQSQRSQEALHKVLLADIATAQELLGLEGYLSRIDVLIPEADSQQAEALASLLPVGLRLERPSNRSQTLLQMSAAFELNLSALSLLALVVGVFLIFNTISFSVVQRRKTLAILRALGATPRQLFGQILAEVALLGLIGALLGLALGVLLGQQVLQSVSQVINDMYYQVEVTRLHLSGALLAKGLLAGVGAALVAAWLPAREAAQTPPVQVLQRSSLEARVRRLLPWLAGLGALLILLGAGALRWPSTAIAPAFVGLAGVVIGAALWVPVLLVLALQLPGHLPLVLWRLAARNLQRALSRTALAATALMLAVSVIIGVDVMVSSFRVTLENWLENILAADLYLSAEGLTPELAGQISELPGVKLLATSRFSQVEIPLQGPQAQPTQGLPKPEMAGPTRRITLLALSQDTASQTRPYVWLKGARSAVWPALEAGEILVSEPLANRLKLKSQPDQQLSLPTPTGPQAFRIRGVYYDYASEQGTVLMAGSVYRRLWQDPGISGLAVLRQPQQPLPELKQALGKRLNQAGLQDYQLRANAELRQEALQIFDRTFAVTEALRLLTLGVAFLGVLSTLLSLSLERQQEQALLRILGLTPWQQLRLALYEAAALGGVAGLLALPMGLIMALVLIGVINLRSFGWSLQMVLQPAIFAQAWLLALGAALLAGLWPALKALAKTQLAQELRRE